VRFSLRVLNVDDLISSKGLMGNWEKELELYVMEEPAPQGQLFIFWSPFRLN